MAIAFVCGNGLSRKNIDLHQCRQHGFVYGCNAMHREFEPDVLVATDRPIAQHIQETGYSAKHKFYTRRPMPNLGAQTVPKKYFGMSSGPIATALAAMDNHHRIYMLGFDMGPDQNNKFNNLYAGTEFYKKPGDLPTFTGNWIRQITEVCRDFPTVKFVRVQGSTTATIDELCRIPNLEHLDVDTFIKRINTGKHL